MVNVRKDLLIAIILSILLLLSCAIFGNISIEVDATNVETFLTLVK